jgi:hypothetical protein
VKIKKSPYIIKRTQFLFDEKKSTFLFTLPSPACLTLGKLNRAINLISTFMLTYKQGSMLLLLIILPFLLAAQIEKGMHSIGLNGNLGSTSELRGYAIDANGDSTAFYQESDQYNVSVSYLHFVSDRLALGIGGGLGQSTSSSPRIFGGGNLITDERVNRQFNIQPQLRYFAPLSKKLYLFVQAYLDLGFQSSSRSQTEGGTTSLLMDERRINLAAGADPGILFMVKKRWGIEAFVPGIQIRNSVLSGEEGPTNLWVNLADGFNLNNLRLGWRIYF